MGSKQAQGIQYFFYTTWRSNVFLERERWVGRCFWFLWLWPPDYNLVLWCSSKERWSSTVYLAETWAVNPFWPRTNQALGALPGRDMCCETAASLGSSVTAFPPLVLAGSCSRTGALCTPSSSSHSRKDPMEGKHGAACGCLLAPGLLQQENPRDLSLLGL